MARVMESCEYRKVVEQSTAPVPEQPVEETPKEENKQYSRSEIARMNTADLKELGKSLGLEVTEESTGKMLKEQIIEKLGL
nr:MAG TPA: Rho termination factor, N-terminal domain [Caudoviricetes sp.]